MSRLILGIDPGSYRTGWGLIEDGPARPNLVECGVIRLTEGVSFPLRLHHLQTQFAILVQRLSPACSAVESPFHGASARSSLQLAHARGVLLAVLAGAGVPVTEYTPATVKKAVTGNGRAEKAQVGAMVLRILEVGTRSWPGDATDALGVALCHASSLAYETALGGCRPQGSARLHRKGAGQVPRVV